ncbi:MAG: hypothetical protein M3167_11690 [Acidobacteriota bacterium]|nr:hypothetical protein [Acidobacteriota bacterium]
MIRRVLKYDTSNGGHMRPQTARKRRLACAAVAGLFCAFVRPDGVRGQSGPTRTPLSGNVTIQDDPRLDNPSQLWSDMYHELSIILFTPPRSHERLEADFARYDRLLQRGNAEARQLDPCVEPLRQATPHAYRAAELFGQREARDARDREEKIGHELLTQAARCSEQPRPWISPTPNESGPVVDGQVTPVRPPPGVPPWQPAPGTQPTNRPGPPPTPVPGSGPCRPYGPGGYDYCNNPEGTRLPPGCVCRYPGIPPAQSEPTPEPGPCENVPPVEDQAALRRTGIELLDTLAGGGQQTSIFLEHASKATIAGIAQMLHPVETVERSAGVVAAVVNFLGNQDPTKWVAVRDVAEAAVDDARKSPAGFLGDQTGAYFAGRLAMPLTTVKACRLPPNAARALSEKARKTERAAKTATRLNRNTKVPGNQPPCGITKKEDCFWRAMRDATGDKAFDKLINGPGVKDWPEVFENLKKYFAGRVPNVADPASHVEGWPSLRQLDDILTKDLARKGSEGLVFVRFQNGKNHVFMGANLTGTPGFIDDQKQFWGPGSGSMRLEDAFQSPPAEWKFYQTR